MTRIAALRCASAAVILGAFAWCANDPQAAAHATAQRECSWQASVYDHDLSLQHPHPRNAEDYVGDAYVRARVLAGWTADDLVRACNAIFPAAWDGTWSGVGWAPDGPPPHAVHRCDVIDGGTRLEVLSSADAGDHAAADRLCGAEEGR